MVEEEKRAPCGHRIHVVGDESYIRPRVALLVGEKILRPHNSCGRGKDLEATEFIRQGKRAHPGYIIHMVAEKISLRPQNSCRRGRELSLWPQNSYGRRKDLEATEFI